MQKIDLNEEIKKAQKKIRELKLKAAQEKSVKAFNFLKQNFDRLPDDLRIEAEKIIYDGKEKRGRRKKGEN